MAINWFPGHMAKALRETEANLKLADVVIYVLDSRAPASCLNPSIDSIIKLPTLYVLNKADMVQESDLEPWMRFLGSDKVVAVNAVKSNGAVAIKRSVRRLTEEKLKKYAAKGVRKCIRAVVVGVPNCGKSTIINNLCGNAKTITGNRAGITRGQQWVRVDDFLEICDTPGTLYPKLADESKAKHLAYIGSIRDEILDITDLSYDLLKELLEIAPNALKNRYNCEFNGDLEQFMSDIAQKRGFLSSGGVVNTEKASVALVDDFRKGRLGKIILEKP